ncbi:MAG: hypothetical protein ACOX4J_09690 [Anaerovoracaceae bacterium]
MTAEGKETVRIVDPVSSRNAVMGENIIYSCQFIALGRPMVRGKTNAPTESGAKYCNQH